MRNRNRKIVLIFGIFMAISVVFMRSNSGKIFFSHALLTFNQIVHADEGGDGGDGGDGGGGGSGGGGCGGDSCGGGGEGGGEGGGSSGEGGEGSEGSEGGGGGEEGGVSVTPVSVTPSGGSNEGSGSSPCSAGGGDSGSGPTAPPSCTPTTSYGGWSDCNAACHNYSSQSRDVSGTNSDCTTFSYTDSQSCYVSCPPVCDFSTNPSIIVLPQTSTLSWVCQYAEYGCSIDNKIGSVNSSSGSVNVVPSKTTTYTLNCNGIDGSGSWQATVTNAFEPIIREVIPR